MLKRLCFLLLWLTPITIALAASQTAEQKPTVLPEVSSYNLEKTKVALPSGFTAPVNLLVLIFDQDRQKEADTWIPEVKQLSGSKQELDYYLLPIFPRQNFLSRWWTNSSMRSSTPDATTWKWTVPLYLNKQEFKTKLNIHSDRDTVVLLVDKTGKVLWRNSGPATPEKKNSLASAVSEAMGTH